MYLGKVRGKGQLRRNARALVYMQNILDKQEPLTVTQQKLVDKFKEVAKDKYGVKE